MSRITVGDVVVCLKSNWIGVINGNFAPHRLPVARQIYRVDRVGTQMDIYWLGLSGMNGRYDAAFFRKIRPADHEFISLLNRIKEPVA